MPRIFCYSLQSMTVVPTPKHVVLGLGNFDGVHLAHRALLQSVKKLRDRLKPHAACGVFCFSRPSSDYLLSSAPSHLSTTEQKLALFRDCGMEYAFLADFPDIMHLTPEQFTSEILLKHCNCVGAVCGFNYRFGSKGAGDAARLKALLNAPVVICDAILSNQEPISSTRIRKLLSNGAVEEAAILLARPYSFTAPVIHGKQLGRRLGTPTLNQAFPADMLIPKQGVYVTDCEVDGRILRAVTNVGVRPTVEQGATVNCESYLLDFSGDLYDKTITVSFLKYIRGEETFSSTEELTKQIQKDVSFAKSYSKHS